MAKEYIPRFEEDEDEILARMLEELPEDWRAEPGDFVHDAVAPVPMEIKQLQLNQDTILKGVFPQYAEGSDLDDILEEIGMSRLPATASTRKLLVDGDAGVVIPKGHTTSVVILDESGNPMEFTVNETETFVTSGWLEVEVTATETGQAGNVPFGSEFIFIPPIAGIRSIKDAGVMVPGKDDESDQDAYDRYLYRVSNPDTGGNKHDYRRWSLDVPGVGNVRVFPRWNGNGTVKVVVVDTEDKPASTELVANLQEYLDPGKTGLGDGKAPCGAQVTVKAAAPYIINVAADVTLYAGVTTEEVVAAFREGFEAYRKEIAFQDIPIAIAKVGSILIGTYGVGNYTALTLNGGSVDLELGPEDVPIIGTVTFT